MILSSNVTASPPVNTAATIKDSPAQIRKAATDFEALLLNQILQSAGDSHGGILSCDTEDSDNSALIEMGQQQLAQAMASNGGLGIAKMVATGLTKYADR